MEEVATGELIVNVAEWFLEAWNWISDQFVNTSNFVVGLLPDSPFTLLSYTPIEPYLSVMNYFIPFDFMLSTLEAWCIAIVVWYSYKSMLKWSNAVE